MRLLPFGIAFVMSLPLYCIADSEITPEMLTAAANSSFFERHQVDDHESTDSVDSPEFLPEADFGPARHEPTSDRQLEVTAAPEHHLVEFPLEERLTNSSGALWGNTWKFQPGNGNESGWEVVTRPSYAVVSTLEQTNYRGEIVSNRACLEVDCLSLLASLSIFFVANLL